MAFQPPNNNKGQKIHDELFQKKQFLLMKNPPPAQAPPQQVNDTMTPSQRSALQQAQQASPGYYVTQESSYGNVILPVLPRF